MDTILLNQKMHIGIRKQCQYVLTTLIANALLIFYTDFIGLGNVAIFGLAILLYSFWNAINDPVFGYYSDIRVNKGKLRLPLIKICMPIMIYGILMAVLIPTGLQDMHIFIYLIIVLVIFDLGKALSMVNYDAFSKAIANSPSILLKMKISILSLKTVL